MAHKRAPKAAPPTPEPTSSRRDVLAAGAVVFRPGRQVLLVHRPRYDDWSFPKGKLDPGEHLTSAAVREVEEETGVHVRLGVPLTGQRYPNGGGRMKSVAYWVGRAVGDDDVSGYRLNDEIDDVEWVPYDEALARLTYDLRPGHAARGEGAAPQDPRAWWCCATAGPAPARPGTRTTGGDRCCRPVCSRPSGWSRCSRRTT